MKISITENKKSLIKPFELKRGQLARIIKNYVTPSSVGLIVYRIYGDRIVGLDGSVWDTIIKLGMEAGMELEILPKGEIVTLENEE